MSNKFVNRIAQFYAADRAATEKHTPRVYARRIAKEYGVDIAQVTYKLEELHQGGYLHLYVDGQLRETIGPLQVKRPTEKH